MSAAGWSSRSPGSQPHGVFPFSVSTSQPGALQHRALRLEAIACVVVATIRPSVNKLILSFTVIRDCGSKHLLLLMSLKVG